MNAPRILIACIGNIFLGDDGFGVEVAHGLAGRPLPPGVILRDFGIRGFDLTYALLESWDLVLLVDACPRGGEPGTVYVIEPDLVNDASPAHMDAHVMNPMAVLRNVKSRGGPQNRILIVGCEPADLGPEKEGKVGLSDPVRAAIDRAVRVVEALVQKIPDTDLVKIGSV